MNTFFMRITFWASFIFANGLLAQTYTVTDVSDFNDGLPPYTLREAINLVNLAPAGSQKIINFALLNDEIPVDNIIFSDHLPAINNSNVVINGQNATTGTKVRLLGNKEISYTCIIFGLDNSSQGSNLNNTIKDVIFDRFLSPLRFNGSDGFSVINCEFYCSSMFLTGANMMIECRQSADGSIFNNLILPVQGTKPSGIENTDGIAIYNSGQIHIDGNQIHHCDQGIEMFNAYDIEITKTITRWISGQTSYFGNEYFCLVQGGSSNIIFGGLGKENQIYGSYDNQAYDAGIICDDLSNILVYQNSFDCLSSPMSNYDATIDIQYVYSQKAGGSGIPGDKVYLYKSGNFNNPVCNYCDNGYLFLGLATVNSKGYWCIEYPSGTFLNTDDKVTAYSISGPDGSNNLNTSEFVTGCHNAVDECPPFLDISINNTVTSCIQMCYDAVVLHSGVPVTSDDNIEYTWFLPGSGMETGTSSVCVLDSGQLTLVVDYQCCSYTKDVQIDFPKLMLLVETVDVGCGNTGSASVTVTDGQSPYTFSLSGAASQSSGPVNSGTYTFGSLIPGSYTVEVTDKNNCVATSDFIIHSTDGPEISINATGTSCGLDNGSATVTIQGGATPYTILWSNGDSTLVINDLKAGTYSVTVEDASGCTATETVQISNSFPLQIMIHMTDASCGQADGSAEAEVITGQGPFTFLWSTGSVDSVINGLAAGQYIVTVTSSDNCSVSDTAMINSVNGPEISINATGTSCGVDNGSAAITIQGGATPYTILWSNGDNTLIINDLKAGAYSVTVEDASGCIATGTVQVDSSSPLQIMIHTTDASCGQADGSAEAEVITGQGEFTFLWSTGSVDPAIDGLAAGQYMVTVTGSDNCSAVDTAIINSANGPAVDVVKTDSECGAASGSAKVVISGGTPSFDITWSTGQKSEMIEGLTPGAYSVAVTDGQGCITIVSFNITAIGNVLASVADVRPTTCGRTDGTVSLSVTGGAAPYEYLITDGTDPRLLTSDQALISFDSLPAGSYNYIIKDIMGCTTGGIFQIGPSDPANFSVELQDFECGSAQGQIIVLASSGVAPFTYSIDSTYQNNSGIFTGLLPGKYNIAIADARGCRKDSLIFTDLAREIMAVDDTARFSYAANPLTIDVIANDLLSGQGDVILVPVNQSIYNKNGLFIGTLIENTRHTGSLDFYFHGVYDAVTGKYVLDYPLEREEMHYSICLVSCPEVCDTGTILLLNDVQCADNNGGYVNTFTPNGDGHNDVLVLPQFPECKIAYSDFKVFNRWGEAVFSKVRYENNWDGRSNDGVDLPEGTYYYVMNFKTSDGKSFVIKNFIELIR